MQFDDDHIVSGSSDNTIKVRFLPKFIFMPYAKPVFSMQLWDIRTNNRWAVMTLTGHSATVRKFILLSLKSTGI